ncbi:MAG: HD domain-containing protein [Candidatus Gracilibacteria bacterium]|nr:HD domain-containing protein [Candidatus Gracilibacteria bacterium]
MGLSKEHKLKRFLEDNLNEVKRRTGQAYAGHGMEVAKVLRELTEDPKLLCCAMAHDLLMHPEGENLLRKAPLTSEEKKIVVKMHQLRRLHIDENVRDLDTVLNAFVHDEEIIILRLAHRLSDIRKIEDFEPGLKKRIARESLFMYAPIAGRLGFNAWRKEIEDVCFRILHPKHALHLESKFEKYADFDKKCLEQTAKFINKHLQKIGIKPEMQKRIKGLYSTYKKLLSGDQSFRDISDRLAVRVIVDSIDDCYRVLGIVHRIMRPIPDAFRDYIGSPKDNGYRSIHTAVYPLPGVTEQIVEVQIRTHRMHQECEYGLAAHFRYKQAKYALTDNIAKVDILRNFEALRIETSSPEKFQEVLQNYLAGKKLIIFDQNNKIYHINKPASVLDFTFVIYGKRCLYLKQAYVNGRERPFEYLLHDGDTVRLVFAKTETFHKNWLNQCQKKASKDFLKSVRGSWIFSCFSVY